MKAAISFALVITLSACSSESDDTSEKSPEALVESPRPLLSAAPKAPFRLACEGIGRAPEGIVKVPEFALTDFEVAIDPIEGTFAFPSGVDQPISSFSRNKVILINEKLESGRSGNPETRIVTFDLVTRQFSYDHSWAGVMAVRELFQTQCSLKEL